MKELAETGSGRGDAGAKRDLGIRSRKSIQWAQDQTYSTQGHSILVAMTNGTRVKVSMETQSYKIVSTRAHEASGRKISN